MQWTKCSQTGGSWLSNSCLSKQENASCKYLLQSNTMCNTTVFKLLKPWEKPPGGKNAHWGEKNAVESLAQVQYVSKHACFRKKQIVFQTGTQQSCPFGDTGPCHNVCHLKCVKIDFRIYGAWHVQDQMLQSMLKQISEWIIGNVRICHMNFEISQSTCQSLRQE